MSEVDKALFMVYTAILIFSIVVGGTAIYITNRQLKEMKK